MPNWRQVQLHSKAPLLYYSIHRKKYRFILKVNPQMYSHILDNPNFSTNFKHQVDIKQYLE